jgi:CubicO group peptidase (beta-lactamase class C family)
MLAKLPLRLLIPALLLTACTSVGPVGVLDAQSLDATSLPQDATAAVDGAPDASQTQEPLPTATLEPKRAADLALFMTQELAKAHVPGLSAAIVKGGKLAWTGAYGFADLELQKPALPQTVYMIASVSKTVTATGVMRAVEKGLVDLDADVQTYLPFPLRSPHFPDKAITLRLLLTHLSGLADNWDVMDTTYVQGDSPVPLGTFLHDYVTPGTPAWDAAQNWGKQEPGTKYDYSDIGVSIGAYAVERATKTSFDAWCKTQVFDALGMTETSFRLAGLDPSHVAQPYGWSKAKGYTTYGLYGYPDYPDGGLRTSAPQLAKFLLMFMGEGTWAGKTVLQAASVAEMKKVQFPAVDELQYLVWYGETRDDGLLYIGHNGGDRGIYTEMFYRPGDGVGVVLLSNGDVDPDLAGGKALTAIEARLFVEAGHL